jgi:hypothetical protein
MQYNTVLHKTPFNNESNLFTDNETNLWKYSYGIRNELYMRKHTKGYGSYLRNLFKRFFILPFSIALKRRSDRWVFIKMLWKSSWNGMYFNPEIEFINPKEAVE